MCVSCATVREACIGSNRWSMVATANGRQAYGPVRASDIAGLFDADFLSGARMPLHQGLTESIPYFADSSG